MSKIVVDSWEVDVEDIVRDEILPFISVQDVQAGLAVAGVLKQVAISPLFGLRNETRRSDIERQRRIADMEDEEF